MVDRSSRSEGGGGDACRPLKAGFIGCGGFAYTHIERMRSVPGLTITAVSDPNQEAAQRLVDAMPAELRPAGDVGRFADYRDMLGRADLDFTLVNSPNPYHVEQLLASLDRGLHVLCEKPLTMAPREVRQVVEATAQANRIVAIGYQSRYRLDARLLRAALRSGKWGRITSVDIYASEDWMTPCVGTWRHDPARNAGGYFSDANGHQLDALFWMTGLEATSVRAAMEGRGAPVPIVTWGEARLQPTAGSDTAQRATDGAEGGAVAPAADHGAGQTRAAQEPLSRAVPPSAAMLSERGGIPFTFTFVGDALSWREEIAIQTEGADFVMRDTHLFWTDSAEPLQRFTADLIAQEEGDLPDMPDTWFAAALRGGPPVLSPPETVWPVLRFTLAAMASAACGSSDVPA